MKLGYLVRQLLAFGTPEEEVFICEKGIVSKGKNSTGILFIPPVAAEEFCKTCGEYKGLANDKKKNNEGLTT